MQTQIKVNVFPLALIAITMYVMILIWAYGDDKTVCHQNGYTSNSISLSLEGVCYKDIADDVVEAKPVEDLKVYAQKIKQSTSAAMCVLSGKDPRNC